MANNRTRLPHTRKIHIVCMAVFLLSLLSMPTLAQDDRLIVAFVEDGGLNAVVRNEEIGDSVSDLLKTIDGFEIEEVSIDLRSPILDAVDLVILVRPLRRLNARQTAHLWDYLENGGNALLAFDPNRYNGVQTEDQRSGFNSLLDTHYGIQLQDNILIEPWFDVIPLFDITRSWSQGIPDEFTPHPITAPLITYSLPLRFWVGRSLRVESVNGFARNNALIYTENLHGEVSDFNLDETSEGQFALNIGEDAQGRLPIAAIAESLENSSRIAVVGDSEIFQNGFGLLSDIENDSLPIHIGDYLFTQRLLQWLLEIPEEIWLPLPSGFTWIEIDGLQDDWGNLSSSVYEDEIEPSLAIDLEQIQLFHNDSYLYVNIDTVDPLPEEVTITIDFTVINTTRSIVIDDEVALITEDDSEVPIVDLEYALTDIVELRIPLRYVTEFPVITQFCIGESQDSTLDCYEEEMTSTQTGVFDPNPVTLRATPMAYVISTANLFDVPDGELIEELPRRTQFAIIGRNDLGNWVKVVNGRYQGWVEAAELAINARRNLLPISEG